MPFAGIEAAICRCSGAKSNAGLRDGSVRGVVATNALELGIDIGALDACVVTGFPGHNRQRLAADGTRGPAK